MRRLLPLLALTAALLPLGGASATCAEPAEGEPTCCPPEYVVEIDDNGVVYYGVQDPLQPPCNPEGNPTYWTCAPPDEGPPRCCESYLYYTEVGGRPVAVPDPRVRLYCS